MQFGTFISWFMILSLVHRVVVQCNCAVLFSSCVAMYVGALVIVVVCWNDYDVVEVIIGLGFRNGHVSLFHVELH